MPRTPTYESNRFAFYELRVGAALVRKRDNRSVYFRPGDDTSRALEDVAHCRDVPEMHPGENLQVFDRWAREYFA